MNRPRPSLGIGPYQRDFYAILDYVDEMRPISGMGSLVSQQSGGRAVHVKNTGSASGAGIRLHNISGLAGHIPDPVKIATDVITAVTGSIALPDPSILISDLTDSFLSVLNGGTVPSQATVQGWVDTYIGTTLSTLIGDVNAAASTILGALYLGLPDVISGYFNAPSAPSPGNGDKLYTESAGICYEIWRQVDGIPSGNSIFRVPFTVGEGEDEQTWVALTLFPAPDIADLISSITDLIMAGLNAILSLASSLLVAAIMAFFNLVAAILPLIEALIEAALVLVWAAIDDLWAYLLLVEARLAAVEAQLAAAVTIDAIDTAGDAQTIKVLTALNGGSVLNDITWIDSSTGAGYSAQWPIWNGPHPNLEDVDWRTMYWMGQDGTHWAGKVLMLLTDGYPKVEDYTPGPLYNPVEVVTCDNGEITILKRDDE